MAEITLSPEQATDIITEARKDKLDEGPVYPGTMPESPDKRVEIATELVGFAIDAWVQDNMRGVEVADILNAAGVHIADDGTVTQNGARPDGAAMAPKETVRPSQHQGQDIVVLVKGDQRLEVPEAAAALLIEAGYELYQEPEPEPDPEPELPSELEVEIAGQRVTLPYEQAQALISAGTAAPVAEPETAPAGGGDEPPEEPIAPPATDDPESAASDPYAGLEMEEPWEGYDAEKDVDIRAKMQTFSDEEIAYVKAYEARHKDRQRIANFKVDPKQRDKALSAQQIAGDEAHSPGADSLELEDAQDAEAAAARDTAGEVRPLTPDDLDESGDFNGLPPDEKMPQAEFEPAGERGMPFLTAHEERELALAEVRKAHLPIPSEVGDPPEFPDDVAAVDDGTLAQLHGKFNSCLALANWKLGLVTVDERAFKHLAEATVREVRQDIEPINPTTGKHKGRELLDREAEDDQRVRAWRDRQFNAELRAIPLRKLVEIYSSYVEVLSRQWTFREKERDSSGILGSRG